MQVGDWGRDGQQNQTLVADAMGRAGQGLEFVISVGDNFYESGLTSVADQQFNTSFRSVYSAANLQVQDVFNFHSFIPANICGLGCFKAFLWLAQVPWHVVLGNHDYGELWVDGTAMPQPPSCPKALNGSGDCSYGPLHQVTTTAHLSQAASTQQSCRSQHNGASTPVERKSLLT